MPDLAPDAAPGESIYAELLQLEGRGTPCVLVIVVEALGSTPQDTGAKMIVTHVGRHCGTVGGGRVEAHAIAHAQALLTSAAQGSAQPAFVNWSLKGDVGMTCGGSVKLYFEPHLGAAGQWPIAIFGAGHIAQALVRVLLPLPCTLTVCDSRSEWLEQLPRAASLQVILHDEPADVLADLPAETFLLCMTKGHTTDRPILQRALTAHRFPFIGVIGSEAKAAVLRRELMAGGVAPERAQAFHCPVGLNFGTNHPHEIALSIAAQLLSVRDQRHAAPLKSV